MKNNKIFGFSLLETAVASIFLSLSLLLIHQFVARSSQSLFFANEVILQKTQNFFSGINLLPITKPLPASIKWKKNAKCTTNHPQLACSQFQIQFPDGKIFIWYKYEKF